MAINLARCERGGRKRVSDEHTGIAIRPCFLDVTSHQEMAELAAEFRSNPMQAPCSYRVVLMKTS